ncbi:hypothetical protein HYDPIDRAFT_25132 [Hydnomerulius pinastri MD-312]|nr:hypothetical protein HYDPIDRAFT_25132 [Hydnomerulius pinastri MD-312]
MDTITALVLMFFFSCLTVTTLYLIHTIFSLAFLLDVQFSPNRLSISWAEPYSAITYPDTIPPPAPTFFFSESSPVEESPTLEIHWPDHPTWDDVTVAPNELDTHSRRPTHSITTTLELPPPHLKNLQKAPSLFLFPSIYLFCSPPHKNKKPTMPRIPSQYRCSVPDDPILSHDANRRFHWRAILTTPTLLRDIETHLQGATFAPAQNTATIIRCAERLCPLTADLVAEGTHPFLAQALDDIHQNIQSYTLDVLEDTPFGPAVSNIGCSQPPRHHPFPHPTLCHSPAQSPLRASSISQRPPTPVLRYPSPIQEDVFEEDVSDHLPIHPAVLAGPGIPGSTFPDTVTAQQVFEDLHYNYNWCFKVQLATTRKTGNWTGPQLTATGLQLWVAYFLKIKDHKKPVF